MMSKDKYIQIKLLYIKEEKVYRIKIDEVYNEEIKKILKEDFKLENFDLRIEKGEIKPFSINIPIKIKIISEERNKFLAQTEDYVKVGENYYLKFSINVLSANKFLFNISLAIFELNEDSYNNFLKAGNSQYKLQTDMITNIGLYYFFSSHEEFIHILA